MRIYKIVKTIEKTIKTHTIIDTDFIDSYIKEVTWYEAKRKGKIFGFWHTVGHEVNDFGILIPFITKNIESVKKYITNYHLYHYGDEKFKIIEE